MAINKTVGCVMKYLNGDLNFEIDNTVFFFPQNILFYRMNKVERPWCGSRKKAQAIMRVPRDFQVHLQIQDPF